MDRILIEHRTKDFHDPFLGGHRQALCGVGRVSTLFLFANRKRRRSFLIGLGEKGTVTRWKNVCACSPPKKRNDTESKNTGLVENREETEEEKTMAANYQMLFELNAALGGGFSSAFTQGSKQIDNMKAKLEALNSAGSTGDILGGVAAALETVGVMKGLEATYETLKECAQASIEFESAMTGVSKTTDMSASELQAMSEAVMKLSTEIPGTTTELANVMEVAGQLGISKDNLLDFSTVMSQLATATTMTADEAATMLAQFANITQMDPSQYSNLASAVVDLGNNYATTEQKIIDMGQGIAAAGSLAGMSEADMMGLSAAVTSLGIETAAGSTSMSKLISKLNTAVETGEGLESFASVAGMSAQQFAQAWGDDAANALATFITGLNDVERNGASANVILGELGITETRMQRMILSLAGSGDLMANAIHTANQAFRENTALSAEAEKRYSTTESRLKMLSNAANNVKISIGDALTPMVASVADGLTNLIEPMAEFIEQNPAIVQGLTAAVGVLGLATVAIGAYTAATKLAAAANLLFGGSIPGIGIIAGVAAAVGGLVFGISSLTDAYNDAHPSLEQLDADFDALNAKVLEQQGILDLVDTYHNLSNEADNLQTLMEKGFSAEIKFTGTVEDVDKLSPDAFVDGNTVELTAEQASLLAANSFLDGAVVSLTAEQAEFLKAQGFLEDDTVFLHPEEKEKIDAGEFVDGTEVYLTGEMANALAAEGYFTDGTVVELTAEKANELKSSEFMADQEIILTGQAGNTLTAADFGLSDQTLIYLAQMDEPSYEAVAAKAKALGDQMAQTKTDISSAQSTLTSMQSDYSALEEKIAGTKNKKEKTALTEQLEELGKSIEDQTTNVESLETKYGELETEFNTASAAVEELAGKKQHLAEVTQALRDSSGGFITATDQETEALNRQIAAYENITSAELELSKSRLKDSIFSQSDNYVKSLHNVEDAQKRVTAAQVAYDTAMHWNTAGPEALKERISELSAEMRNLASENIGEDLTNVTAFQNARTELEGIIELITGLDKNYAPGAWDMMIRDANNLTISQQDLNSALLAADSTLKYYKGNVTEAGAAQTTVLENMINAVADGTIETEELEKTLMEAFSQYENGGEIVAQVMEQVKTGVEAARAAAEGSGSQAQTEAETTVAAVGNIITQMENLKKAYDEAKASALASLGNRFGLFDDKGDPAQSKTTAEMKTNLEHQQDYWEQYNTALEKVLNNGIAKEITTQLTDGSAESLATLQTLAEATPEEVAAINEAFAEVETSKDALASTIADMETNFTEGMEALKTELENTVKELDKGSEAAEAAATTMEAYVASLKAAEGDASSQASAIADAVNAALATIADVDVNINYHYKTVGTPPEGAAGVEGHDAIGTDYAAAGLTMVGEEGPEIVMMNGGEKVLTAHETVNALSGSGGGGDTHVDLSFPTTYNVNGGNAEEIRRALEQHDEDLRDKIERVMEDIQTDQIRTRYR